MDEKIIRTLPTSGTDRQRKKTASANRFEPTEFHTTYDQYRAWMGGTHLMSGGLFLGEVNDEMAMLALNSSHSRGCWPNDTCKRTDLNKVYLCVSNNGGLTDDWTLFANLAEGGGGGGSLDIREAWLKG